MAGKKKPSRSSARLNANKKASTSLKTIVNEASSVEPASPTSLSSEEASSTSRDLRSYYNIIEAGGQYKDYEAERNQAKALLARELIHEHAKTGMLKSDIALGDQGLSCEIFTSSPIGAQQDQRPGHHNVASEVNRLGGLPVGANDVDNLQDDLMGSGLVTPQT